jgi:hypothetical protein
MSGFLLSGIKAMSALEILSLREERFVLTIYFVASTESQLENRQRLFFKSKFYTAFTNAKAWPFQR